MKEEDLDPLTIVIVLCLVPDLPYPEGLHQPVLEPHTVDVPEVLSVVMSVH